jgi:salicylate hydroxylase
MHLTSVYLTCLSLGVNACSGAGVGGLTLALTLGIHSEHQVDLYEAGAEISTIGAGIAIWARTFEVLQLLGLHERMRERGISLDGADQLRACSFCINILSLTQRYACAGTGPKFRRSDQAHAGYNFLTDAISSAFMYRFNILGSCGSIIPLL